MFLEILQDKPQQNFPMLVHLPTRFFRLAGPEFELTKLRKRNHTPPCSNEELVLAKRNESDRANNEFGRRCGQRAAKGVKNLRGQNKPKDPSPKIFLDPPMVRFPPLVCAPPVISKWAPTRPVLLSETYRSGFGGCPQNCMIRSPSPFTAARYGFDPPSPLEPPK